MSILGFFKIVNPPRAARIWFELASSFNNFSQAICEFCDNAISNFVGHEEDRMLVRTIRILIRKEENSVDVTIEDGGTGIQNINNALTLGGIDSPESVLNEHGYGLKHGLAYMEGQGSSWEIATRTREDAALNRYQVIRAPYDFGIGKISGEYHSGWIGSLSDIGTVIHFSCPMNVFATLDPSSRKKPSFQSLTALLRENLRYTYADILCKGDLTLQLVIEENGEETEETLQPLLPLWDPSTFKELPIQDYNLGNGNVKLSCQYGDLLPNRENLTHYLGDMETSGVELRLNGRAIEHGLLKRIWGRKIHPSQNGFLVRVNIETTSQNSAPSTKTAKNGFRETDPLLKELFKWIRSNVELSAHALEPMEKRLVRKLAEKLEKLPDMTRISIEAGVFCALGLNEPADLLTCRNGQTITVYEAKVKNTKARDLYQLRLYWDGCVADGVPPDEGVLIAAHHPQEVQTLLAFLNTLEGPDGRPYNFHLSTWKQEGISTL